MEHIWILYENALDAIDEKSYYCANCNMKTFTWSVDDSGEIKNYKEIDLEIFFYNDFTCDEYLIKRIIE